MFFQGMMRGGCQWVVPELKFAVKNIPYKQHQHRSSRDESASLNRIFNSCEQKALKQNRRASKR